MRSYSSFTTMFDSFSVMLEQIISGGSSSPATVVERSAFTWPLLLVLRAPPQLRLGFGWVLDRVPLLCRSELGQISISLNTMLQWANASTIVTLQVAPSPRASCSSMALHEHLGHLLYHLFVPLACIGDVLLLVLPSDVDLAGGATLAQNHRRLLFLVGGRKACSAQEQLELGVYLPLEVSRSPL